MFVIKNFCNKLFSIFVFFSRTEVFCVMLFGLMVILIVGTISQKEIGLYSAQQKYFLSNFVWLDFFPLPGGQLIMFFIFFGLVIKLIKTEWKKYNIGVIIVHMGILVLLFGGFVATNFSKEGFIVVDRNQDTNDIIDDTKSILIITMDKYKIKNDIFFDNFFLKYKHNSYFDVLFFIDKAYKNCNLRFKKKFLTRNQAVGVSRFFNLTNDSVFLEENENKVGVSLVFKYNNCYKYCYLIENFCDINELVFRYINFNVNLNKCISKLPFSLRLSKIEKSNYPGTNTMKMYKTQVIIKEKNLYKNIRDIDMNKPLRYKGYTFYQTSFIENKTSISAVFTVVKNTGFFFPYISFVIVVFGFFLHLYKVLIVPNRR